MVTDLGKTPVILGLPWLAKHNPRIDWSARQVELEESRTPETVQDIINPPILRSLTIAAKSNTAMELAQKHAAAHQDQRSVEEIVPEEYGEFLNVFSKEKAKRFPPARAYDHAIKLKEDFVPKRGKVFPLTLPEQKAMNEFIEENLAKGYIVKSDSPQASSFFFVGKKAREGAYHVKGHCPRGTGLWF